jgi:glycerophosphoryl diester phosphodiesterase
VAPVPRPYLTREHPLRFAHRGSRHLWPENTMTAFQGAADLGYVYIETDLHVTRDGRVVIFHDNGLDRLTDGTGNVWEWRWEDLRRLDAAYHFDPDGGYPLRGTGVGIPLLEEALADFPGINFNLDLKQPRIERAVADEVARLGVENRVLVGAFYDIRVRRFRRASAGRVATASTPGEVIAGMAAARLGRPAPGAADAYQVPEKQGPLRVVSEGLVRSAHRAGRQVHVWTVNDPADMDRLLDWGVDGIVTDRPDLLNEVVAAREAS